MTNLSLARIVARWLLMAAALLAACSSDGQGNAAQELPAAADEASAAPAEPAKAAARTFTTQSNDEAAVTVEVTPLNLGGDAATLEFEVAFNTHSVDLSFDPAAISVLRDAAGGEYPAIAWEGGGPGGHHREGVLRFQAPDQADKFVEVVVQDVAGVPERVFRWELTQ